MNNKEYRFVSPPPISKPFQSMSISEAKEYYSWHRTMLDNRLLNMGTVLSFNLQSPPESLTELWDKIIAYHKCTIGKAGISGTTDAYESLIACAGLYIAEVFVKNNPQIIWDCNTDAEDGDIFKNKPVLKGFCDKSFDPPFKMVFEPYHMIHVQASRINRGNACVNDLLDLYQHWCKLIC